MSKLMEIEGVTVFTTAPSDVCLIISGAVHGNEPAGPKAMQMLRELISKNDWVLSGNVYGIISNPRALEQNVRFIEENLNRAFGRNENPASYEALRAEEISCWLTETVAKYHHSYLLDLHSVSVGETRIAIFPQHTKKSKQWCEHVSPIPFVIGSDEHILPGTLMGAMDKLGGISVSIECGNHTSEHGASVALQHIENALESLSMPNKKRTSYSRTITYDQPKRTYILTDIIKPTNGFVFTHPVESETFLKKGEVFARDTLGERTAPYDCFIIMPSKNPQPNDYDAGFLAVLA